MIDRSTPRRPPPTTDQQLANLLGVDIVADFDQTTHRILREHEATMKTRTAIANAFELRSSEAARLNGNDFDQLADQARSLLDERANPPSAERDGKRRAAAKLALHTAGGDPDLQSFFRRAAKAAERRPDRVTNQIVRNAATARHNARRDVVNEALAAAGFDEQDDYGFGGE